MSKLPEAHKFLDLSDFGRPFGKFIASRLKNTSVTPIQVTLWFFISGILATIFMFKGMFWTAAFFIVLKSILDAADGELSRLKNTPSYTGRYLDSIADIILNFIFISTIAAITNTSIYYAIAAFLGLQLQGTLYNYYYVILRNTFEGDTTSRIFENKIPKALPGENQSTVNYLFKLYKIFYGGFDKVIYYLDRNAATSKTFPNWFMTVVSIFGLGFQLLIISIMLVMGWAHFIIPVFISLTLLILVFIGIRKIL